MIIPKIREEVKDQRSPDPRPWFYLALFVEVSAVNLTPFFSADTDTATVMLRAAAHLAGHTQETVENQMSDRAVAGIVHTNVPSHASSTRHSITRMRPGSTSAPGAGVDVKHGSYDRYLARLKGRSVLRTQAPAKAAATPLQGNKTRNYGIAYYNKCLC